MAASISNFTSLAPLSTKARRSIAALDKPPSFATTTSKTTTTSTTTTTTTAASTSTSTSESSPLVDGLASGTTTGKEEAVKGSRQSQEPLPLPNIPLETAQQFLDWYSRIERHLERQNDSIYEAFNDKLVHHCQDADNLLAEIDHCRGFLAEINANYRHLLENSAALHDSSEALLAQLGHINAVTDAISSRLAYFRELDSATRFLNSPGHDIVLQDEFLDVLERLDICLEFMNSHPHYHEANVYMIRFQQRLTRAMTLIKYYFVSLLRQLATDVDQHLPNIPNASQTTLDGLLYHKFRSAASMPQILLSQLEKRAQTSPQEYDSLLGECLNSYFAVRSHLLSGVLNHEVDTMLTDPPDVVSLARSGCTYLIDVCNRERDLFLNYFSMPHESSLEHFLESLCDHLYDKLRPLILHEPKLDVLCQLCTVLNALMSLDNTNSDNNSNNNTNNQEENGQGFKFKSLLEPILQDAQTRLVFRAQAVIQQEVLYYVPTDEDLDYPELLKGVRGLSLWTQEQQQQQQSEASASTSTSLVFHLPDEDSQKAWYPALRKTMWVLSRLHGYVSDTIFRDFAGEAVHVCQRSLLSVGQKFGTKQGHTPLDGHLFIIRHLLILKELIRSVDLADVDSALDYYSVTDSLRDMLRQTTSLLSASSLYDMASRTWASKQGSNSLITSFDTSQSMKDAKLDLDMELKQACEKLIHDAAISIVAPLSAFMKRAREAKPTTEQENGSNKDNSWIERNKDWAGSDHVQNLHDSFFHNGGKHDGSQCGTIEVAFGDIVSTLGAWLDDPEAKTLSVLLPSIQEEIVEAYVQFYLFVRQEYGSSLTDNFLSPTAVKSKLSHIAKSGQRLIKR